MDDNEVLGRLCCEMLEIVGYRAVPVSDASRVLGILQSQGFDLLITDQNHEGPSGVELAESLKEVLPNLPVIIVSGNPPSHYPHNVVVCIAKTADSLFPILNDVVKRVLSNERQSGLER